MVWSSLAAGVLSLVCGGTLLACALGTGRQELWAIGYPIVWAGQIVLLIGLIFQLDRVRRDHRNAAAKLETVDRQIHELKATTSVMGTMHGPSGAFYAHWANGASPELLLNDLKSQLDLLAVRLSQIQH